MTEMTQEISDNPQQPSSLASDPAVMDWSAMELPDTWVDKIDYSSAKDVFKLMRAVLGRKREGVALPEGLPGKDSIPKYILQEFHRLPNGNYSKRITRGYITGFEHSMLGSMKVGRAEMAQQFVGCQSVLDVGCSGGRTARALRDVGVKDVWGLDPSPYLLQHAAVDNPDVNFVQGTAENTGFAAQRFDGITACFLFHEMPPRYIGQALAEFSRILKPGGKVCISEPAPEQVELGIFALLRRYGWRGAYYGLLAKFVYEPFIMAWHKTSTAKFFNDHGFDVLLDESGMPLRHITLQKR
ncbi:hypothetical protein NBRC116494_09860 [Aurantivibrio plasticivorans]